MSPAVFSMRGRSAFAAATRALTLAGTASRRSNSRWGRVVGWCGNVASLVSPHESRTPAAARTRRHRPLRLRSASSAAPSRRRAAPPPRARTHRSARRATPVRRCTRLPTRTARYAARRSPRLPGRRHRSESAPPLGAAAGYSPNRPMSQDIGDPRCANIPPWAPPSFNEADISDKPVAMQALPLLPDADGWPMVTYCEEMLGVDRAVGQVIGELEDEGRLDNTLLVFASDNGMAWGEHRLGQQKVRPYTTPVALHMRWPAGGWESPRPSRLRSCRTSIWRRPLLTRPILHVGSFQPRQRYA